MQCFEDPLVSYPKVMHRESRAEGHGKPSNFRGLVLTGWSRYDHFAVLCELLPVSVPSLVANLILTSAKKHHASASLSVPAVTAAHLKCPRRGPLPMKLSQLDFKHCRFPGHKVFGVVLDLQSLRAQIETRLTQLRGHNGWTARYNYERNFTATWRLREPLRDLKRLGQALKDLETLAVEALDEIYDHFTVNRACIIQSSSAQQRSW